MINSLQPRRETSESNQPADNLLLKLPGSEVEKAVSVISTVVVELGKEAPPDNPPWPSNTAHLASVLPSVQSLHSGGSFQAASPPLSLSV